MDKKLYLSLMLFAGGACRGALTQIPAVALFAQDTPAAQRWDELAQELKVQLALDMVIANCEQLPSDVGEPYMFSAGSGYVSRMDWSTDGRLASKNSHDRVIKIWNSSLTQVVRTILARQSVYRFAWDKEGVRLAYSGSTPLRPQSGKIVSIFNLTQGAVERNLAPATLAPDDFIDTIVFADDGRLCAGSAQGIIMTFDIASGQLVQSFATPLPGVSRIVRLAWGNRNKELAVMQGDSTAKITTYDIQNRSLRTMDFDPRDGRHWFFLGWDTAGTANNTLNVGLEDGTILNINIAQQSVVEKFRLSNGRSDRALCMAQSVDGRFAIGYASGVIEVWTDYSQMLRRYFAQDVLALTRTKSGQGRPVLSQDQAYAQMLMALLFFNLKVAGKPLTIPDAVREINARARKNPAVVGDVTTVQELEEIRNTFPESVRVALDNTFTSAQ